MLHQVMDPLNKIGRALQNLEFLSLGYCLEQLLLFFLPLPTSHQGRREKFRGHDQKKKVWAPIAVKNP